MKLRLTPIAFALLVLLAPRAAAAQSAAPISDVDATLPEPSLTPAPRLVPPVLTPPARPTASDSPPKPTPSRPAPATAPDTGTIFLRADRIEGAGEKSIEASGKVELRTRRETVLADWLRYDVENDEIWGKGDVLIRYGIDWITGPEVKFKRGTETGFFASPRFFVGENGGRGSASEIRFAGPNHYEASDARYTTCVAPREDWYIRMGELEVDKSRMVGTGRDATVYFFGAPVIYSPWFEFPLSNERKSGFLTPTTGLTGIRGFEYAQPYYLNLAPNYDATIMPRLMTKRGIQLNGTARYLFDTAQGEAAAEYLHNDHVTGTDRYLLSSRHTQNLDSVLPGLVGYWNLNKVSDDTYFSDLSDRVGLTSQTTLPREGGFAYSHGPWGVLVRAQGFQTLQDPTEPQPAPYNRVPQGLVTLREIDWNGLTFAGTGEYAYFRQPTLTTGQRIYAWPTVAVERQGAAWSFTARTGVHMREYDLNEVRPGVPSRFGFAIPISSVDGSLVFERDWDLAGQKFVQTLEPRAFYVYVPYRDQSKAPTFDTAVDDFNFGQLFSVNRYLGNDRIGDANQLTLALTSRFLDPNTGAERLRIAVGQRYYFHSQRVVLNESPRSAASSDVLVGAEGRLSDAWSIAALWQYNQDSKETERVHAGIRYTPAPGRVFNASYTYSRQFFDPIGRQSRLNQFDLSWQLPVNPSWTLLGRWNFSVLDSKTLEAVAGVEYNADCWALRLVGQRLATTSQTTTNSVYLQIELNGLARFGTNPLELLRRSVPGYQQTNDPTVSPRFRDDAFQEY
ncbi:MAG: LPS assembly protein LptD [Casimicrobiaceae bacterium]